MQYGCPHYSYVMEEVISRFHINDPDRRKQTCPIKYGVRIYQYETPTTYRQIVKIK
jgi:hypothetical protein